MPNPIILTRAQLVAANACSAALGALDAHYPDGFPLDAGGVDALLARPEGVEWGEWLVRDSGLCPAGVRAQFRAARAAAWAQYRAANDAAWAQYHAARAAARTRYDAARAAAWAQYRAANDAAWAQYDAARAPHLRAALLAWGADMPITDSALRIRRGRHSWEIRLSAHAAASVGADWAPVPLAATAAEHVVRAHVLAHMPHVTSVTVED